MCLTSIPDLKLGNYLHFEHQSNVFQSGSLTQNTRTNLVWIMRQIGIKIVYLIRQHNLLCLNRFNSLIEEKCNNVSIIYTVNYKYIPRYHYVIIVLSNKNQFFENTDWHDSIKSCCHITAPNNAVTSYVWQILTTVMSCHFNLG